MLLRLLLVRAAPLLRLHLHLLLLLLLLPYSVLLLLRLLPVQPLLLLQLLVLLSLLVGGWRELLLLLLRLLMQALPPPPPPLPVASRGQQALKSPLVAWPLAQLLPLGMSAPHSGGRACVMEAARDLLLLLLLRRPPLISGSFRSVPCSACTASPSRAACCGCKG